MLELYENKYMYFNFTKICSNGKVRSFFAMLLSWKATGKALKTVHQSKNKVGETLIAWSS
jgi:hypothetical protein